MENVNIREKAKRKVQMMFFGRKWPQDKLPLMQLEVKLQKTGNITNLEGSKSQGRAA